MKFLERLGLAVFSIIILTLSIVLILIGAGFIEPTIFSILITKIVTVQNYIYVLYVVCGILALLALKCLFFTTPTEENDNYDEEGIQLQNEDGTLLITKTTLCNIVDGVVMEIPKVHNSQTNVIIDNEGNVSLDVTINVANGVTIKDVSSKLQSKIKKTVKESTDLELKFVNIQVINVEIDDTEDIKEEKEPKESKSKAEK